MMAWGCEHHAYLVLKLQPPSDSERRALREHHDRRKRRNTGGGSTKANVAFHTSHSLFDFCIFHARVRESLIIRFSPWVLVDGFSAVFFYFSFVGQVIYDYDIGQFVERGLASLGRILRKLRLPRFAIA